MNQETIQEAPELRILIVDDDDDVREALQDELELSYHVTSVESGEAALDRLAREPFDAIISDQRMPGMSGVRVLEAAQQLDPHIVRILLTGFLDEDARRATLSPGAPYKIGKPWHEEIEVTLKRAFEHRQREHDLSGSVVDALAVAGIDAELATADNLQELAQNLVRRCHSLRGVSACYVLADSGRENRVVAGSEFDFQAPLPVGSWSVDLPLDDSASTRLRARGTSDRARDILSFLASRAKLWGVDDRATRLAKQANVSAEAREKLSAVSRRATVGSMSASLVHELASVVQNLQGALFEIEDFVHEVAAQQEDRGVVDALENAVETSSRLVSLFRAMRTFVRTGEVHQRPCSMRALIDRSLALCRGHLRSIASFSTGEIPEVEIEVSEPLFLQVLVNLLKNAADAAGSSGEVSLTVEVDDTRVEIRVQDNGPDIDETEVKRLFEPFSDSRGANSLGLSISAEIAADHGGELSYRRAPSGGSIFAVEIPRNQR